MAKGYVFDKAGAQRIVESVRSWEKRNPPRKGVSQRGQGSSIPGNVMLISSIGNDTLSCTLVADSTTVTTVAKPYLLRRTPFDGTAGRDGYTYSYSSAQLRVSTTTGSTTTETQAVTPNYVVGDEIVAIPIAGPAVSYTTELDSVVFLDLNIDGRCWAKVTT